MPTLGLNEKKSSIYLVAIIAGVILAAGTVAIYLMTNGDPTKVSPKTAVTASAVPSAQEPTTAGTPDSPKLLKLGETATISNSAVTVGITPFEFLRKQNDNHPNYDASLDFAGIHVKACVVSAPAEGVEFTSDGWYVRTASGERFHAEDSYSNTVKNRLPELHQRGFNATTSAGQCVTAWVPVGVYTSAVITEVIYNNGHDAEVSWSVQ